MTDREIVELLERTGHLKYPFGKRQEATETSTLAIRHPAVERAIASYQEFMIETLDPLSLTAHSRPARCDGGIGPATRELMAQPRCGCPDYGKDVQPAVGTGSWKSCHGIGDFHAATVYIDESGMPSFLKPYFDEVWNRIVATYEAIGLRFIRVYDKDEANIVWSWVRRLNGAIGLAIVGRGQSCGSQIWCKFLATWQPTDIVAGCAELGNHELGHNAGLQHTRGGIMNPSIIRGLPATWKGDPSEPILKRYYGGEPIDPTPPLPPDVDEIGLGEWYRDGVKTGRFFEVFQEDGAFKVLPRAKVPT